MNLIRIALFATPILFLLNMPANGQEIAHVPGQILASLDAQYCRPELLAARLAAATGQGPARDAKKVSDLLNVWLFEVPVDPSAEREALEWFRRQPEVRLVQFNHILECRKTPPNLMPDDPLYPQQWQHMNTGAGGGVVNADLDSDLAWNIATGGTTPLGDTIVVAVIDGGVDGLHEDLRNNMWSNHAEIPGDHLDNDGNGYIDDFRGWNVYTQNDNIGGTSAKHGTPVSAIIGAQGNNGIGVAGINWKTKIMFVSGNDQESAVLAAYDYVLKARKRYNVTNGQQGAFVVAVNCSWGVTYGQPAAAPLWCAAFDSLGEAGIIGVAATANTALDVDVYGDLPTACPSEYLIAVTSLTKEDQKAANAAWGLHAIDLGAYGQDVFTAGAGNLYDNFNGTSFAAPQVSGAVGLLYSSPCSNLAAIAHVHPAAAARKARELILGSAVPNVSLQNITATGGRLNLFELLQDYEGQCVACLAPFALNAKSVKGNECTISWSKTTDVQSVSIRWRQTGNTTWNFEPSAASPLHLSGLKACTEYEISMRSNCGTAQSAWSTPVVFKTADCCEPPAIIHTDTVGKTSAKLTWNAPSISKGYQLRIRPQGGDWQVIQVSTDTLALSGLSPCTQYDLEIQTWCDVDSLSEPALFSFTTAGCGPCTDLSYCAAKSLIAKDEWISSVQIGNWSHVLTGNSGYMDFTGDPAAGMAVIPAFTDSVPVTLAPGFSGLPYLEYFRLYIDYSGDGYFDDPADLAFDPGYSSDAPVSGMIYLPAIPGALRTRMRVLMKYKGPSGNPPAPCETFEFGQVRDYCIQLGDSLMSEAEVANAVGPLLVFPQPARERVFIRLAAALQDIRRWALLDTGGRILKSGANAEPRQGLLEIQLDGIPGGMYLLRLEGAQSTFYQKILKSR